ncbi:MerR family transcriptional regulator [Micromonospora halotolerans]|uniref:MerR family transcriptional regulator n=1 Tax=Micromonospora halotolerans TaxID=709879 RepID=A0ABY9ZQ09_9ACTN|nr:MerR family transcriptional regulator [Micromonospora halotolerans]WNM37384.1 MerR family transcriptional regulator [Micromonospora halotolerans]
MLTIGQLASYAGVTVRAVRHYHQIGLLPEPERDASGYRRYGAGAVVTLLKIRALADAGVPLSEITALLRADEADFTAAIHRIDGRLSEEITRLETSRKQIAQLAAGNSGGLPPEVLAYLDRLREIGVSERVVEAERDGWILVSARWPDQVRTWMPFKFAQLEDPRMVRLYLVLSTLVDGGLAGESLTEEDAHRLMEEAADIMAELSEEAYAAGETAGQGDPADELPYDLLDALADEAHPGARMMRDLMRERGWTSWTRQEKLPERM